MLGPTAGKVEDTPHDRDTLAHDFALYVDQSIRRNQRMGHRNRTSDVVWSLDAFCRKLENEIGSHPGFDDSSYYWLTPAYYILPHDKDDDSDEESRTHSQRATSLANGMPGSTRRGTGTSILAEGMIEGGVDVMGGGDVKYGDGGVGVRRSLLGEEGEGERVDGEEKRVKGRVFMRQSLPRITFGDEEDDEDDDEDDDDDNVDAVIENEAGDGRAASVERKLTDEAGAADDMNVAEAMVEEEDLAPGNAATPLSDVPQPVDHPNPVNVVSELVKLEDEVQWSEEEDGEGSESGSSRYLSLEEDEDGVGDVDDDMGGDGDLVGGSGGEVVIGGVVREEVESVQEDGEELTEGAESNAGNTPSASDPIHGTAPSSPTNDRHPPSSSSPTPEDGQSERVSFAVPGEEDVPDTNDDWDFQTIVPTSAVGMVRGLGTGGGGGGGAWVQRRNGEWEERKRSASSLVEREVQGEGVDSNVGDRGMMGVGEGDGAKRVTEERESVGVDDTRDERDEKHGDSDRDTRPPTTNAQKSTEPPTAPKGRLASYLSGLFGGNPRPSARSGMDSDEDDDDGGASGNEALECDASESEAGTEGSGETLGEEEEDSVVDDDNDGEDSFVVGDDEVEYESRDGSGEEDGDGEEGGEEEEGRVSKDVVKMFRRMSWAAVGGGRVSVLSCGEESGGGSDLEEIDLTGGMGGGVGNGGDGVSELTGLGPRPVMDLSSPMATTGGRKSVGGGRRISKIVKEDEDSDEGPRLVRRVRRFVVVESDEEGDGGGGDVDGGILAGGVPAVDRERREVRDSLGVGMRRAISISSSEEEEDDKENDPRDARRSLGGGNRRAISVSSSEDEEDDNVDERRGGGFGGTGVGGAGPGQARKGGSFGDVGAEDVRTILGTPIHKSIRSVWSPDEKALGTPKMAVRVGTPATGRVKRGISPFPSTPPLTPNRAAFARRREAVTAELVEEFNERIFGGQLPGDLEVVWSRKLNKTAGRTYTSRTRNDKGEWVYVAKVELSTKVVDDMGKLRNTLVHEMCHAASWVVNRVNKPPHGSEFKYWGFRAESTYDDIRVTTCHNYEINYKYTYGRHSKSINTQMSGCGQCRSRLALVDSPRVKKDGTPYKENRYNVFVKENFKVVPDSLPSVGMAAVLTLLAASFRGCMLNIGK
ncbi:hypothetical protein HDV00_006036 [Rhizophlyctis rosea]|nr:hypothetical protein HDV00_006036 [Rhizophlyctis rosea]